MTTALKDKNIELRKSWMEAKRLVDSGEYKIDKTAYEKVLKELPNMSQTGYVLVKRQMEVKNLTGLPGLDMKTFKGWQEAGFVVKKGEKSTAQGITWIFKEDEEKDIEFAYPKQYFLFHTSQVEPIPLNLK